MSYTTPAATFYQQARYWAFHVYEGLRAPKYAVDLAILRYLGQENEKVTGQQLCTAVASVGIAVALRRLVRSGVVQQRGESGQEAYYLLKDLGELVVEQDIERKTREAQQQNTINSLRGSMRHKARAQAKTREPGTRRRIDWHAKDPLIQQLRKDGHTWAQIAAKVEIHKATIFAHLATLKAVQSQEVPHDISAES